MDLPQTHILHCMTGAPSRHKPWIHPEMEYSHDCLQSASTRDRRRRVASASHCSSSPSLVAIESLYGGDCDNTTTTTTEGRHLPHHNNPSCLCSGAPERHSDTIPLNQLPWWNRMKQLAEAAEQDGILEEGALQADLAERNAYSMAHALLGWDYIDEDNMDENENLVEEHSVWDDTDDEDGRDGKDSSEEMDTKSQSTATAISTTGSTSITLYHMQNGTNKKALDDSLVQAKEAEQTAIEMKEALDWWVKQALDWWWKETSSVVEDNDEDLLQHPQEDHIPFSSLSLFFPSTMRRNPVPSLLACPTLSLEGSLFTLSTKVEDNDSDGEDDTNTTMFEDVTVIDSAATNYKDGNTNTMVKEESLHETCSTDEEEEDALPLTYGLEAQEQTSAVQLICYETKRMANTVDQLKRGMEQQDAYDNDGCEYPEELREDTERNVEPTSTPIPTTPPHSAKARRRRRQQELAAKRKGYLRLSYFANCILVILMIVGLLDTSMDYSSFLYRIRRSFPPLSHNTHFFDWLRDYQYSPNHLSSHESLTWLTEKSATLPSAMEATASKGLSLLPDNISFPNYLFPSQHLTTLFMMMPRAPKELSGDNSSQRNIFAVSSSQWDGWLATFPVSAAEREALAWIKIIQKILVNCLPLSPSHEVSRQYLTSLITYLNSLIPMPMKGFIIANFFLVCHYHSLSNQLNGCAEIAFSMDPKCFFVDYLTNHFSLASYAGNWFVGAAPPALPVEGPKTFFVNEELLSTQHPLSILL